MHVLILGARAPACLEWARAFDNAGWEVTTGDSMRWPVSRFSHASHDYLRLPEVRTNPDAWIQALCAAVTERAIDLILPTCEESFYLAYRRDLIPCEVIIADFSLMHRLHHKGSFAKMIQGWPIEAPTTHVLESREDLAAFAEPVDWVFKPAYSRFANRALIRPQPYHLSAIQPSPEQQWVAQRFIAGREHCSFSLLVKGRITAHACYHPRYRVGRGSGIWFEPTNPPAIQAFVEHFGAQTTYTGQVAFDFIEQSNGRCYAIECNPRATSGIHLFDDQHHTLVQALLGRAGVLTPTLPSRQVALAMLLFAIGKNGSSASFWHDFSIARDVITRRGDFAPLPAQILGLLEIVSRAVRRRCGLLEAATADSEWNGQSFGDMP